MARFDLPITPYVYALLVRFLSSRESLNEDKNWTWAFLGYTGFAYGSHAAQFRANSTISFGGKAHLTLPTFAELDQKTKTNFFRDF